MRSEIRTSIPPRTYRSRDLMALALPMMASLVLELAIGFTDAAFLGRTTESALAAAAVAGVFFMTVLMLGVGYSYGMQAAMARANGEGKPGEVGRIFRSGTLFLMGYAAAATLFCTLAAPAIFNAALANADVARDAGDYVFWRGIGLAAALLCAAFRAYFIATLQPGVLTQSAITMIAVNILLNALLIFGAGPIPAMGIAGAAIASALSELAALAWFAYAVRGKHELAGSWKWHPRLQRSLFRLGRWVMLQEVVAFAVWFCFFLAVERLGTAELALSNVLRNLSSFLFLFIHALGSTTGAVAANLLGEGRERDVPGVVRRGLVLTGWSTGAALLLCSAAPNLILRLMTDISDVQALGLSAFWVMIGSIVVGVPGMFLQFVLAGVGSTKASAAASLAAAAAYLGWIALMCAADASLAWFWSCDWIYFIATGLVAGACFRKLPWMSGVRSR